jgi:hypothetical protein
MLHRTTATVDGSLSDGETPVLTEHYGPKQSRVFFDAQEMGPLNFDERDRGHPCRTGQLSEM